MVTLPTAAQTKNMEPSVINAYVHRAHLPIFKYPSIILFPVAFAYLEPNSKKGYLRILAIKTAQSNPKPNNAPALVLCTRCDTPIAVLAKRIPGPKVLSMFFREISIF